LIPIRRSSLNFTIEFHAAFRRSATKDAARSLGHSSVHAQ
jgi:hypothetical protein